MLTPYPGISKLYILSNETRGKYVLLAVKICSWLQVLRMVFYIMIARTYATNGMRSKLFSQLLIADTFIGIPLNIAFPIVFILWMARAYHNLHRTGIPNIQFSAGWSVGAWFVPFMNLVRPYKIMKEIWYRKQLNFRDENHEPEKHTSLRVWWGFYILPAFIGGFFAVILLQTYNDLTVMYGFQAFVHCGLAISLFALTDVLKKLTSFENEFQSRFLISQTQKVVELADSYRKEQGIPTEFNAGSKPFIMPQHHVKMPPVSTDWHTAYSLGRSATICFCAILIGAIWRLGANILTIGSTDAQKALSEDVFTILNGIIALVIVAGSVMACVYFVMWLNRVYNNLIAEGTENLSVRFKQLAYWWIIPLYNLYILFSMMRDISVYAEGLSRKKSKGETLYSPGILFLSLLLGILTAAVAGLMNSAGKLSDLDVNLVTLLSVVTPMVFGTMCLASILFMKKVKAFTSGTE